MPEQKYLHLFEGADYQYATQAEFAQYQQKVVDKINRYGLENVIQAFTTLMTKYLHQGQTITASERAALTQAYVAVQYLPQYPKLTAVFNDTIRNFAAEKYQSYAEKLLIDKGIDEEKWSPEILQLVASQLAMPFTHPSKRIPTQMEMYNYIIFLCNQIKGQR